MRFRKGRSLLTSPWNPRRAFCCGTAAVISPIGSINGGTFVGPTARIRAPSDL